MNKYILFLAQSFILFLFWYLLSGKNIALLLLLGVIISILITIYQQKLKILDDESLPIAILPRAIIYWIWLYKEIASVIEITMIRKLNIFIAHKLFYLFIHHAAFKSKFCLFGNRMYLDLFFCIVCNNGDCPRGHRN